MRPTKTNALTNEGAQGNAFGDGGFPDGKCSGVNPQHQSRRGRKLQRSSPPSERPYFVRVAQARGYAQIHAALHALVPRLLRRGQQPAQVASDLSQLASVHGFRDCVAPFVNDLALKGAA